MVGGPYDAIVEAAARKYRVPPEYIRSVMQVESSGRPDALGPVTRSGQRAGGLMQLMPATYAEVAEREGLGPDRMDPTNNIFAGTAYLRQNNDRFGGDWGKTFAAYNAGPSRVERGGPLPAETRAYVPKVQAGIQGADVAQYGQRRSTAGMTEEQMMQLSRGGMMPAPGSGGLLQVDEASNWLDGLGGLLGAGQTPSQPPAIDPQAMPGTTQTDRLGVGSRMNDLMQQLLQPPRSALSPGQYQLAGASAAVTPLAGVTNRKVGIGELLGALGGGLTRGAAAGEQAQRDNLQDQLGNLSSAARLQGYQQTQQQAAAKVQAAQQLASQLRQSGDPQKIAIAAILERDPSQLDAITGKQVDMAFPKPGEGFSLGQGETRFDASGRPIATVDPKPLDTSTTLLPAEVAALGLPVGTVAQRGANGQISVVSKPEREGVSREFEQGSKLRSEFVTQAKPLADARQMYGRVDAAYNDQSGQADIALVYSFMKMLDPTSVVREGEFATAENAGGIPDRVSQLYNRALRGERLPPQVRDDMLKQARAQYGAIEGQHSQLEKQYRDLAQRNGVRPEDVVIDLRGGVKPPAGGNDPLGIR